MTNRSVLEISQIIRDSVQQKVFVKKKHYELQREGLSMAKDKHWLNPEGPILNVDNPQNMFYKALMCAYFSEPSFTQRVRV